MNLDIVNNKAKICFVAGPAASGKSSLIKSLQYVLGSLNKRVYTINLDPAVNNCIFNANLDIRDNINYNSLLASKLGPNGSILASLNIFFSKYIVNFIDILTKNCKKYDYILIDTPGQIELFASSNSSLFLFSALCDHNKSAPQNERFNLVFLYTIDSVNSTANINSFITNLLYSCSVLYRFYQVFSQKNFIILLTKIDMLKNFSDANQLIEYCSDLDLFEKALNDFNSNNSNLAVCLNKAIINTLVQFYKVIEMLPCSSNINANEELLLSLKKVVTKIDEI